MKRIKRNPERFEVIDLFTAIGREHGYKINTPNDFDDFIDRIGNSLKASHENLNMVHGKRIEALFAHVAGALGQCKFIKQEDSGEIFSDSENMQAPDYRVILKSGEQLFIEVKNCHLTNPKSQYPFTKRYVSKLEKYSELHSIPLKFAVYFSKYNKWFLLSKTSLIEQKKRFVTNFVNGMAMNEMALLGDRMIGTEPDLSIQLLGDQDKESVITEDGKAKFTIGSVNIFCAGKNIRNEIEKKIAFYLIRFGDWLEQEPTAIMDDGKLKGAEFTYSPEFSSENQNFQMIGELSSMVSTAYGEHTVEEQNVIALDAKVNPAVFSVDIPEGYKGTDLPLWQFTMQTNPDFKG